MIIMIGDTGKLRRFPIRHRHAASEWFTGFPVIYDRYRPSPPAALIAYVKLLAGKQAFDTVVDLGSGSGKSSRYWSEFSGTVVGIEPVEDMRLYAEENTQQANVIYLPGFGHQTNLPSGCADVVTCFQSLHWMEPKRTFVEIARLLKPGGLFVAGDYDWPPIAGHSELDQAWQVCMTRAKTIAKVIGVANDLKQWNQKGHLKRMQKSKIFRFVKEVVMHQPETRAPDSLIGAFCSQGHVMALLKAGVSEEAIGIPILAAAVTRHVPMRCTWYWASRARIGVV